MNVIKKEIELPKEMSEVAVLIVEFLKEIIAKKNISQITTENIPLLMNAVQGFDQLAEELKDERVFDLAAFMAADIAKVLKKKPAVA